jgi:hypothetical protein
MSIRLRIPLLVGVAFVVACALAACGSSSKQAASATTTANANPNEVVARVGELPVTRAQVNHWMMALAGGDYYEVSRHSTIPEGLVSDPPNYARCAASLEAAAAKTPSGNAKESGVQLVAKCRQLYQALKVQAASYLVSVQRAVGLGHDEGVTVSDGQLQQFFQRLKAREYPTEAAFQQYLTSRRRNRSDVLLEAKLNLLGEGIIKKIKTPQGRAKYGEAERRWTEKTNCQPGYVVEGCKQYKGGATYPSTPSPSILMEQVAALASGRCVNLAACGKQVGK